MTANEVSTIVFNEIGDSWETTNAHEVNLRKCLVLPPIRARFKCVGIPDEPLAVVELWIVLEEDPIKKDGYKIVFDEEYREFGLAMLDGDGDLSFLGRYGDFLTILECM